MLSPLVIPGQQPPLIHEVCCNEEELAALMEGEWFQILINFPWRDFRPFAADYYNALYDFNQKPEKADDESVDSEHVKTSPDKDEARQIILFDRATAPIPKNPPPPPLYQGKPVEPDGGLLPVRPEDTAPGVIPLRLAGRKPKCFFALIKGFIGASLMGQVAEPDSVHWLLTSNPAFARACGFALRSKEATYHCEQVPSLRKLEQFDQIMTDTGLWGRIKYAQVMENFNQGVIEPEGELVGDTTHYHAYSSFEVVPFVDARGNPGKKSRSKLTKKRRCEDWDSCPHDWVQRDEGAGTIVKSATKMYWGHKGSIIGLPGQGVIIDARAVSDAATHDGQTFLPHAREVLEHYPPLAAAVHRVLYDSACDDAALKQQFAQELGLELVASFNPRRGQPITEQLPRGIEKITPYGEPVCLAGYEFDYQGIRYANETFLYRAPMDENNQPVCRNCEHRAACCNRTNATGRRISAPFDRLPHIDPGDPPMAKQFKAILARRPSVERMIKRLKCDLGDDRLSKRGNASFQAYLDKTLIAYHLLLRHLY